MTLRIEHRERDERRPVSVRAARPVLIALALVGALVGLSLGARPASAQDARPGGGVSVNEKTLSLKIKRGEEYEVLDLLEKWGATLGHAIVPDKQLAGVKIRFLWVETELNWALFKSVLGMNGVIIVEEEVSPGRLLIRAHLQRNIQAQEGPPFAVLQPDEVIPKRSEIVTAVLQIQHGAGADIFTAVRALQNRDRRRIGTILHVRGPEVIIVVDLAENCHYYKKIIAALDVPGIRQEISIRKLRWTVASDTSQVLSQILQTSGGRSGGGGAPAPRPRPRPGGGGGAAPAPASSGGGAATPDAQIIAHDPTNSLIIRAFESQKAEIEKLIDEIDVRVRDTGPKFHVYKCRNADAIELAGKLNELFTGAAPITPDQNNQRQSVFGNGGIGGGGGALSNNGGFNQGGGGFGNQNGFNNQGGFGNQNNRFGNQNNRFGNQNNNRLNQNNRNNTTTNRTNTGSGQGLLDVLIVPDELTNSILVQAEEDDYIVVLQMVRQLDRKKRRVVIQAEVWEVLANDSMFITTELASTQRAAQDSIRPLGISSFGASQVSTDATGTRFARGPGSLGVGAGGQPTLQLGTGLTAFLTRDELDKIPILLSTLATYSKSKMVTSPFTLTNDNERAVFSSVQQEPFSTTTINNVASQQNVQFVNAESTLDVQPTVNNDDSVTLQVSLIISSFGLRSDPTLPPPQNSREYQGTVTVPNGRFVAFGGLDSQTSSISERKIPLLGDIPILGHLFKSWNRSETETKIYVFIRPTIFRSTQFREDVAATDALLKKAHIEAGEESWVPTIVPSNLKRDDAELQDKVFEYFGTGSASPFAESD